MALPNITPNDLTVEAAAKSVINRQRTTQFYCPEPALQYWKYDFSTSADAEAAIPSGSFPITVGQGKAVLSTGANAGITGNLVGYRHFPHSQLAATIRLDSCTQGTGAYSDIAVGFALTPTTTSNTPQYYFAAFYRSASVPGDQVFLQYSHAGGGGLTFSTPDTLTLVPPCDITCILDNNSMTMAVDEGGKSRIVAHLEIPTSGTGGYDMELQSLVNRLRPFVFWQTNTPTETTFSDWRISPMGTLGDREHAIVSYEDGEPIRDGNRMLMIVDEIGPTTIVKLIPPGTTEQSEYTKSKAACRYYDPATGVLGERTATYAVRSTTKVYGMQEVKVVFDRDTRKYHLWASNWNDTSVNPHAVVQYVWHYETYENILYGNVVLDIADGNFVDFSACSSTLANAGYGTDVIKYNGRWYYTGTVSGTPAGLSCFVVSGSGPNSWDRLEFIESATRSEGAAFFRCGGVPYVYICTLNGVFRIIKLDGSALSPAISNATWGMLPGTAAGNAYSQIMTFAPYVHNGRTEYQGISFSRVDGSEDYVSDFTGQTSTTAFGPTIAFRFGTGPVTGEEFSSAPRSLSPKAVRRLVSLGGEGVEISRAINEGLGRL